MESLAALKRSPGLRDKASPPARLKPVAEQIIAGTRASHFAWKATMCARAFFTARRTTSPLRADSVSPSRQPSSEIKDSNGRLPDFPSLATPPRLTLVHTPAPAEPAPIHDPALSP